MVLCCTGNLRLERRRMFVLKANGAFGIASESNDERLSCADRTTRRALDSQEAIDTLAIAPLRVPSERFSSPDH